MDVPALKHAPHRRACAFTREIALDVGSAESFPEWATMGKRDCLHCVKLAKR